MAVTAAFMTQGLLFASWAAHIPILKARLGLSDADLGTALLGAPAGSVVGLTIAGWLLPRIGSRLMVQIVLVGYCTFGILVGLSRSLPMLALTLGLWGACQGALGVAMNTQAVSVGRALGRPIMASLHGSWSIGAFTGAGVGALAVAGGGFGTLGLGVALIVPTCFGVAGRVRGLPTGRAVAIVSGIGWFGFMTGPPLIGHLAGVSSLAVALGVVPALLLVASVAILRAPIFDPTPALTPEDS